MADFAMWTVYDHPADYPDYFVARKWIINRNHAEPQPTDEVIVNADLNVLRGHKPPWLYSMPRHQNDDPCIVETWF